jgi:hypothetical protein
MKFKKFVVGFDPHGDQQDKEANSVFFKFIEQFKPDYRIAGGDIWDFRPLRKKATDEEKRESMKDDYEAGRDWLERLTATHLLLGNHDARLWKLAESDNGVRSDYAQKLIVDEIQPLFKKLRCRVYPYHKREGVMRLGSLNILHGFFGGLNAARQHALMYNSCLFGHIHAVDVHSAGGLERRVARACGALCNLDMEYNETQPNTLRQANGFPFGVIDEKSGNYVVWQAENINGRWIIPSDIEEIKP